MRGKIFASALMASLATADVQSDILQFGTDLATFNSGMMSALQVNPDDATYCKTATDEANVEIVKMFDFNTYASGTFDFFSFLDQYQITMIKLDIEGQECGYRQYLQRMDDFFSHWDRFGGTMANVLTEIIVYYATSQGTVPAVIKAWTDYIIPGFQYSDPTQYQWEVVGEGWMLFLSQLVKFEMSQEFVGGNPVDGISSA